jgi:hypothetical protein
VHRDRYGGAALSRPAKPGRRPAAAPAGVSAETSLGPASSRVLSVR